MENFGKKIHQNVKKLLTVGAFVGTAAMGFSKESGKTIEKTLFQILTQQLHTMVLSQILVWSLMFKKLHGKLL